jgi:3-polyprenyl-4-hydroxybenzoate decarboxylase
MFRYPADAFDTDLARPSGKCRHYPLADQADGRGRVGVHAQRDVRKLGRGSKIAIDATRKWPEEDGPSVFPPMNRTLLEQGAPQAFARVDRQWGELVRNWRPATRKA